MKAEIISIIVLFVLMAVCHVVIVFGVQTGLSFEALSKLAWGLTISFWIMVYYGEYKYKKLKR